MIHYYNVKKTYKSGVEALKGVSFEIETGEFVFVIGKSGSGKSTLLKCMTKEEDPTEGKVTIDNFDITHMSRALIPVLRRNIGMIYQDFRLIETKTVEENIAFVGEVVGIPKKSLNQAVKIVLNVVGLKDKANTYPQELSGGEQQRVALARALVNNADIIIADEPTGNVDPQMSLEIVELLKRLNETGTTVIMVTHAHDLVRRFDNRVIVLDGGAIVSDGAVDNSGISISPVTHLNVEKTETFENRITQRFVSKPQEAPSEAPAANENPDEDFLNAIVSDNETYRVYVEDDEKTAASAENTEGGDA